MRKLLLITGLFLFLKHPGFAQYQSIFGTQSTSWEVAWSNLFGKATSTFSVQKDTIVNNIAYKKVTAPYPKYEVLLREDTVSGKVWFKSISYSISYPADTIEQLIFDFSLQKGDTFDISNPYPGAPGTYPDSLNIVHAVYYSNNTKYIEFKSRVNFGSSEPLTFIEGVGGNKGIVWKAYGSLMAGEYLLCSYKNGLKTDYTNKEHNGNCNITGIPKFSNSNQLKIFPNPVRDFLNYKISQPDKIKETRILNVLGQIVFTNSNSKESTLPVSFLYPGLYILQITFKDGSFINQPFLKSSD